MINKIINIDEKTKIVKCKSDKSGVLFDRILDISEDVYNKLSNTESALSDVEIEDFKKFMGDNIKTDCWCKHLSKFIKG